MLRALTDIVFWGKSAIATFPGIARFGNIVTSS